MRLACLAPLLLSPITSLGQTVPVSGTTPNPVSQFATVAGSVLRLDTGQPLKKAVVTL